MANKIEIMTHQIRVERLGYSFIIFLGLYLAFSFPNTTHAAPVTFDSSSHVRAPNVTLANLPVTIAEKDEMLLCFTSDDVTTNTDTVTFNGVPMTSFTTVDDTGGFFKLWGFYLLNPATSTHDAIFTRSTADIGNEWWMNCGAYKNVEQTAPEAFGTLADPSGTCHSANVTTETPDDLTVMYGLADLGGMSAGTNSTLRGTILNTASGLFDSNGGVTSVGAHSMTFNSTNGAGTAIIVSLAPETSHTPDCGHHHKKHHHHGHR